MYMYLRPFSIRSLLLEFKMTITVSPNQILYRSTRRLSWFSKIEPDMWKVNFDSGRTGLLSSCISFDDPP